MKKILYNLLGYSKFELEAFSATYVTTKLLKEFTGGIFDVTIINDKRFSFCCYSFLEKKILSSSFLKETIILNTNYFGIPEELKKRKKRFGIVIGIILFILVLQVQRLFVWDIVISGNTEISDEEITETLENAGFSKGTLIRTRKIPNVCNKCIILNKNLTWISINMSGTVAFVEVSERIEKNYEDSTSMSGLMSCSDGVIELVKVTSGSALVEIGDSVTKGQMLVSPVAIGKDGNEYIVGAKGEIIAKTYENFAVAINYTSSIHNNIESNMYRYKLDFLGRETAYRFLNFSKENHYYIDKSSGRLKFPGNITLPISYKKFLRTDYDISKVTLSQEEVKNEAYSKLYEIMSSELINSEILSTDFKEEINEHCYILRCEVVCLKNIVENA